jgi:hypothetical protein|tara:strand:- start:31 stop:648 length:618 start_codon:yes stop_codon:yes gene_type:complete
MDIDLKLFKNIMAESRHNNDLLDSFSPNQFKSKERLIKHIRDQLILNTNSEIVIFGGWYGSILIPAFKEVKRITLIDKDKDVINIAKNRLFNHYKNVDFICDDVFNKFRDQYISCDLFINTSCEHMKPMKEWGSAPTYKNPWWDRVSPAYFAFQSNNMLKIEGHINCVYDLDDFKKQLPDNAKVMIEDEIKDDRGTRFLLIGKYE